MTGPWMFIDRINEAEKTAHAGCATETIIRATGLTRQTVLCVKGRVAPDYGSPELFEGLLKNTREIAE